jgi:hypothetical protein
VPEWYVTAGAGLFPEADACADAVSIGAIVAMLAATVTATASLPIRVRFT